MSRSTGVPTTTIYRWRRLPAFVVALSDSQAEALKDTGRILAGHSAEAAARLLAEMHDHNDGTPATRIRAAHAVLENMLVIHQATELEERIARLERGTFEK